MVLYHWSQSTRLVREGALGPLSFIYERQYTEQFVDNQQEQKTVNLAELKHKGYPLSKDIIGNNDMRKGCGKWFFGVIVTIAFLIVVNILFTIINGLLPNGVQET